MPDETVNGAAAVDVDAEVRDALLEMGREGLTILNGLAKTLFRAAVALVGCAFLLGGFLENLRQQVSHANEKLGAIEVVLREEVPPPEVEQALESLHEEDTRTRSEIAELRSLYIEMLKARDE